MVLDMNIVQYMKQMEPKTREEMIEFLAEGCDDIDTVRKFLEDFPIYDLTVTYAIALKNNTPKPLYTLK